MKKRILPAILIIVMLFGVTVPAFAAEKTPVPEVTAQNVYMLNTNTGASVYEKSANEKVYPASLTKLCTMLVASDLITDFSQVITVPDGCYDDLVVGSSSINLKAGEEISLNDIMYAIAISSANEAANALAIHLCGSIQAFVDKMNVKAKELGATNTHFVNCHGLHDDEHYTTAKDMSLIAKAAFSNKTVFNYISTPTYEIEPTNKYKQKRALVTTNSLMRKNSGIYYKYCKAGKTGTTTPAGYNLISIASKNDTEFILVAMHAPKVSGVANTIFNDSKLLYDWGFTNYKNSKLVGDSDVITEVEVELSAKGDHLILLPEKSTYAVIPVDMDVSTLERKIETEEKILAPITQGDILGKLTLSKGDITYAAVNLIAGNDVKRSTVLYYLHLIEQFFSNLIVKIIFGVVLFLIVIYIIIMIMQNKRRKKRSLRRRVRF